jgi:hypothetical protein
MIWATFMTTCAERESVRAKTLSRLAATDWGQVPELAVDDGAGKTIRQRIFYTNHRMLVAAQRANADAVLLLEDDLDFHIGLRAHVETWPVFAKRPEGPRGFQFFGSLYNPGIFDTTRIDDRTLRADMARKPWGAQAIVTTPATLGYVLARWDQVLGGWSGDLILYALAHQVTPVYFHSPSLVQHVGETTWGGQAHRAPDFVSGRRSEASYLEVASEAPDLYPLDAVDPK